MKVTMLYFNTIDKLIEKYGFTWNHVDAIDDKDDAVIYGDNNEFSCSLEHMFYCTHMGGFDETTDNAKKLITAFLEALQEVKKQTEQ